MKALYEVTVEFQTEAEVFVFAESPEDARRIAEEECSMSDLSLDPMEASAYSNGVMPIERLRKLVTKNLEGAVPAYGEPPDGCDGDTLKEYLDFLDRARSDEAQRYEDERQALLFEDVQPKALTAALCERCGRFNGLHEEGCEEAAD